MVSSILGDILLSYIRARLRLYWVYIGILEKKMEATLL